MVSQSPSFHDVGSFEMALIGYFVECLLFWVGLIVLNSGLGCEFGERIPQK